MICYLAHKARNISCPEPDQSSRSRSILFFKITCNYTLTFVCGPYVRLLPFAGKGQYLCELRALKSPLSVARMIGDRV